MQLRYFLPLLLMLGACSAPQPPVLALPEAVSDNAMTMVGPNLYSFGGLKVGKTWKNVTDRAFRCDLAAQPKPVCNEMPGFPDHKGRLAASAVTVGAKVIVFGGYTVAEDGTEVSTPNVWSFDPETRQYKALAPMPVPVDDTLALVYQDRYVYLVSGWHDHDNVNAVQVYDAQTNHWTNATPYGGAPVFGHAGGLVGNVLVSCGGVRVEPAAQAGGKRKFVSSPDCWRGMIDPQDPRTIRWTRAQAEAHFGYRMGATSRNGLVIFAGGADHPYNYDGVGYDGKPAIPGGSIWAYDVAADKSISLGLMPAPGMDYRGMGTFGPWLVLAGGMNDALQPVATIALFPPQP